MNELQEGDIVVSKKNTTYKYVVVKVNKTTAWLRPNTRYWNLDFMPLYKNIRKSSLIKLGIHEDILEFRLEASI